MLTAPRRAAVLGRPVSHSLSPLLHRAAYEHLGLDAWTYEAYDVGVAELPQFLADLGPQWAGLSLTMPLKERALTTADSASPLALQVGAANTLIRGERGTWHADNTDVAGVRAALEAARATPPRSAAVLGSGATARAGLAALAQLGVRDVTFVVRDTARESTLAQARDHGLRVNVVAGPGKVTAWADADVVLSTTPPGASDLLAQSVASVIDAHHLADRAPAGQVFMDVVYAGWPTRMAQVYGARGASLVGGIEMLIHQAAAQVTLMTGRPAPLEVMQAAGRNAVSG